jgi:hypothetical protein
MNAGNDNNANRDSESNKSSAASRFVWVIYFVGYDETGSSEDEVVEPYVGRERIETTEASDQVAEDAELAALLRGGRVVAVVADDEAHAERTRQAIEMEIMRYR